MRRALGEAMVGDYDHYLWMNDDTTLDDGVLAMLVRTEHELRERGHDPVIVVGTTRHPVTDELTYGGQVRLSRWRPLAWTLVQPGDEPRPCETMNGNTVLVPRAVVRRVGNIDPVYVQQMGDLDYGLRAVGAGCEVWVAPGTVGTCASHPQRRTDLQPLRTELARLWSVKELAPRPWFRLHAPLGRATVAALLAEPLPAQGVRTGPAAHAHPSYRLGRSVGAQLNAAPDAETSGDAPDTGRANLAARAASGLSWSALTEAKL